MWITYEVSPSTSQKILAVRYGFSLLIDPYKNLFCSFDTITVFFQS